MLFALFYVVLGLVLLTLAGDKLVAGAAGLAARFRVSPVFIGIVIIGFGTSLPEILATASATLQGETALALGNIVGSNSANVGLILAVALLLSKQTRTMPHNGKDYGLMLIAMGFVCLILTLYGELSGLWSYILIFALFIYLYLSLKMGADVDAVSEAIEPLNWLVMYIIFGLIGLVLGAQFLVSGATDLATLLGVPAKIIGITMVAIGTSLPELAATVAAVRKGQLGLTVGNILGSNVFNILGAAGVASLFAPLPFGTFKLDLIWMLAFSLLALPLFLTKRILPLKFLGFILGFAYVIYIYQLVG